MTIPEEDRAIRLTAGELFLVYVVLLLGVFALVVWGLRAFGAYDPPLPKKLSFVAGFLVCMGIALRIPIGVAAHGASQGLVGRLKALLVAAIVSPLGLYLGYVALLLFQRAELLSLPIIIDMLTAFRASTLGVGLALASLLLSLLLAVATWLRGRSPEPEAGA